MTSQEADKILAEMERRLKGYSRSGKTLAPEFKAAIAELGVILAEMTPKAPTC